MMSRARRIAEAGTVATETGLTPRQLADQRAELLAAAKAALDNLEPFYSIDYFVIKKLRSAIRAVTGGGRCS